MQKILVIERWSDDHAWASNNSWPLKAYCHRVGLCTDLKGTELKRISRALMKKELLELHLSKPDNANALIHTLESSGAKVTICTSN